MQFELFTFEHLSLFAVYQGRRRVGAYEVAFVLYGYHAFDDRHESGIN